MILRKAFPKSGLIRQVFRYQKHEDFNYLNITIKIIFPAKDFLMGLDFIIILGKVMKNIIPFYLLWKISMI